jgi:hypothetical protein
MSPTIILKHESSFKLHNILYGSFMHESKNLPIYQDNDKNKIKDYSKIISLSSHVPLNDLSHENSARNKELILVFLNINFRRCLLLLLLHMKGLNNHN